MTLNINLPPAVETAILARAAAEGKDIATYVTDVMTQELAKPESPSTETSRSIVRSPQGFAQRLDAWINAHPRNEKPVDDNRESIYAGRDE